MSDGYLVSLLFSAHEGAKCKEKFGTRHTAGIAEGCFEVEDGCNIYSAQAAAESFESEGKSRRDPCGKQTRSDAAVVSRSSNDNMMMQSNEARRKVRLKSNSSLEFQESQDYNRRDIDMHSPFQSIREPEPSPVYHQSNKDSRRRNAHPSENVPTARPSAASSCRISQRLQSCLNENVFSGLSPSSRIASSPEMLPTVTAARCESRQHEDSPQRNNFWDLKTGEVPPSYMHDSSFAPDAVSRKKEQQKARGDSELTWNDELAACIVISRDGSACTAPPPPTSTTSLWSYPEKHGEPAGLELGEDAVQTSFRKKERVHQPGHRSGRLPRHSASHLLREVTSAFSARKNRLNVKSSGGLRSTHSIERSVIDLRTSLSLSLSSSQSTISSAFVDATSTSSLSCIESGSSNFLAPEAETTLEQPGDLLSRTAHGQLPTTSLSETRPLAHTLPASGNLAKELRRRYRGGKSRHTSEEFKRHALESSRRVVSLQIAAAMAVPAKFCRLVKTTATAAAQEASCINKDKNGKNAVREPRIPKGSDQTQRNNVEARDKLRDLTSDHVRKYRSTDDLTSTTGGSSSFSKSIGSDAIKKRPGKLLLTRSGKNSAGSQKPQFNDVLVSPTITATALVSTRAAGRGHHGRKGVGSVPFTTIPCIQGALAVRQTVVNSVHTGHHDSAPNNGLGTRVFSDMFKGNGGKTPASNAPGNKISPVRRSKFEAEDSQVTKHCSQQDCCFEKSIADQDRRPERSAAEKFTFVIAYTQSYHARAEALEQAQAAQQCRDRVSTAVCGLPPVVNVGSGRAFHKKPGASAPATINTKPDTAINADSPTGIVDVAEGLEQYLRLARSVRSLCRFSREHLQSTATSSGGVPNDFCDSVVTGVNGSISARHSEPNFSSVNHWDEVLAFVQGIQRVQTLKRRLRRLVFNKREIGGRGSLSNENVAAPPSSRSGLFSNVASPRAGAIENSANSLNTTTAMRRTGTTAPSENLRIPPTASTETAAMVSASWIVLIALILEARLHEVARLHGDTTLLKEFCCCQLWSVQNSAHEKNSCSPAPAIGSAGSIRPFGDSGAYDVMGQAGCYSGNAALQNKIMSSPGSSSLPTATTCCGSSMVSTTCSCCGCCRRRGFSQASLFSGQGRAAAMDDATIGVPAAPVTGRAALLNAFAAAGGTRRPILSGIAVGMTLVKQISGVGSNSSSNLAGGHAVELDPAKDLCMASGSGVISEDPGFCCGKCVASRHRHSAELGICNLWASGGDSSASACPNSNSPRIGKSDSEPTVAPQATETALSGSWTPKATTFASKSVCYCFDNVGKSGSDQGPFKGEPQQHLSAAAVAAVAADAARTLFDKLSRRQLSVTNGGVDTMASRYRGDLTDPNNLPRSAAAMLFTKPRNQGAYAKTTARRSGCSSGSGGLRTGSRCCSPTFVGESGVPIFHSHYGAAAAAKSYNSDVRVAAGSRPGHLQYPGCHLSSSARGMSSLAAFSSASSISFGDMSSDLSKKGHRGELPKSKPSYSIGERLSVTDCAACSAASCGCACCSSPPNPIQKEGIIGSFSLSASNCGEDDENSKLGAHGAVGHTSRLAAADGSSGDYNPTGNWGPQIAVIQRFMLFCFCAWSAVDDEVVTSGNACAILEHVWWCINSRVTAGLAERLAAKKYKQELEHQRQHAAGRPTAHQAHHQQHHHRHSSSSKFHHHGVYGSSSIRGSTSGFASTRGTGPPLLGRVNRRIQEAMAAASGGRLFGQFFVHPSACNDDCNPNLDCKISPENENGVNHRDKENQMKASCVGASQSTCAEIPSLQRPPTDFYAEYLALPTSCSAGVFEMQVFRLLKALEYRITPSTDAITKLADHLAVGLGFEVHESLHSQG